MPPAQLSEQALRTAKRPFWCGLWGGEEGHGRTEADLWDVHCADTVLGTVSRGCAGRTHVTVLLSGLRANTGSQAVKSPSSLGSRPSAGEEEGRPRGRRGGFGDGVS